MKRNWGLVDFQRCAAGLKPNDWYMFADRVWYLSRPLGAFEELHAAAADWNSPPVSTWAGHALYDAELLRKHNVRTSDQARALWRKLYVRDAEEA